MQHDLGDGYEWWPNFYEFHKLAIDELNAFEYDKYKKNGCEASKIMANSRFFCAMVVLYFPAVRNVPGAHEVTGSSLRLHLHQSTQKFMSGTNLHFPRNTFVYSG